MTADDRPTKTCPDCAEEVLEAARKCRFCGYRFDGADRAAPAADPDGDAGVLSGLIVRRRPRNVTTEQIVDAAGANLGPEEVVSYFRFGTVNGLDGIIVVTTRRMLLLEAVGKRHRVRFENDLVHVLRTEYSRRLGRSRLEVRCAGGETLLVAALKRDELLELQLLLSPPGG